MDKTLLEGMRVLDLTNVFMGPVATQILGDFGADVIKVEALTGDTTRQIGPMRNPNMGNAFLNLNRNKRSIALNLKDPDALSSLMAIAAQCDIFVSNIRPAALERLGITHQTLSQSNPGLITAMLVGFSQAGPYAKQPVYEDLIQGLTAVPTMLTVAGSDHPIYVPMAFNDRAVGMYAASAMLAAYIRRERTGKGMEIEIPMFETMAHGTLIEHLGGMTFDPPMGPPGYPRSLNSDRRPFPTKDGHLCVVIYTDQHWQRFMTLLGREDELAEDPRLQSLRTRTEHAAAANAIVADVLSERTTDEWLSVFSEADIPATPMNTLEGLVEDPHLGAIGFFEFVEHPSEGSVRQMQIPGTWSESQPTQRRFAPRLGEHSVEVLSEAGVSEEKIQVLVKSGAVSQAE